MQFLRKWDVPFNTPKNGVLALEKLGILEEATGRRRNKLFASRTLLDILTKR